jgi:putative membrane protein
MFAFGALVIESQALKKDLSVEEAWRLVIADTIYSLSARANASYASKT